MLSPDNSTISQPFTRINEQADGRMPNALLDAWQQSAIDQFSPQNDRHSQQAYLAEVVARAVEGEASVERRQGLQCFGDIANYMWFSTGRTPMPRGLIAAYVADEPKAVVMVDHDYISPTAFNAVRSDLLPAGFGSLVDHHTRLLQAQTERVMEPPVTSLLMATPGYRLLESFFARRHIWQERPLTDTEKQIEQQMAEQRVRQRHTLAPNDRLFEHPAAQLELARINNRIDLDTRFVRRPEADNLTPLQRARGFFRRIAAAELGGVVRGSRIDEIKVVDDGVVEISSPEYTDSHASSNFATWTIGQHHPQNSNTRFANTETECMIEAAVLELFSNLTDETLTFEAILRQILARRLAINTEWLAEVGSTLALPMFSLTATMLLAPSQASRVYDSFVITVNPEIDFVEQHMLSRSEYRQGSKQKLASVLRRPADDRAPRLVHYPNLPEGLPLSAEDAVLLIRFYELGEKVGVSSPGYELVSYNPSTKTFGLRATPEADPHTECTTLIPDEARMSLAATYAELGLRELATLVYDAEELTVAQLARYISRTNRYALPSHSQRFQVPRTLAGFAPYVRDGRLPMQCVGSSHFMEQSLHQVFGRGSAHTVGGDYLGRQGGYIRGIGHQQTAFTDPETGLYYIIDATSPGFAVSMLRDSIKAFAERFRTKRDLPGPEHHAPVAQPTSAVAGGQEITPPSPAEIRENLFRRNRNNFLMQLRLAYIESAQLVPQDALLDHVASLHSDDIVFRATAVILHAHDANADPDEPAQLLEYLRALTNCKDPAILRSVDPHDYANHPRLINALQQCLAEAQRVTDL